MAEYEDAGKGTRPHNFCGVRQFHGHRGAIPNGIKGSKRWTLGRIDPADPEYAPGKVKWASKKTQSINRSSSIKIESKSKSYTIEQLAKRHKVSGNTIRMRLKHDWTHDELMAGKRLPSEPAMKKRLTPHEVAERYLANQQFERETRKSIASRAAKEKEDWIAAQTVHLLQSCEDLYKAWKSGDSDIDYDDVENAYDNLQSQRNKLAAKYDRTRRVTVDRPCHLALDEEPQDDSEDYDDGRNPRE